MIRTGIDWKPIAWLSLAFGVFFALTAGGQYWFVKSEIRRTTRQVLDENIKDIADAIGTGEKVDIARYTKAYVDALDYVVVLNDGIILDIATSKAGLIPGLISEVETPPFSPAYFAKPQPFLSATGEHWTLFAKELQGGYVVVGTSEYDDVKDPEAKLIRNLDYFGSTLDRALTVNRNVIDIGIYYVIIDNAGVVRGATGGLSIKTNPIVAGNVPNGLSEKKASGKTALVLKSPVLSQTGRTLAVVISWMDISPEQQVLDHELYFGIGLAVLSWLIFLAFALRYWTKTEAAKRYLRQAFQNYLSPQVMEAILREPENLKLGGQRREVTILFSDIRSFTSLAEKLPPQQLTHLLQEYFNEMTEEVIANEGVVDKFIGDAIMAFWGAPIDQPDQADRAVRTATNMIKRLKGLQEKWLQEGYPVLDIGIGINLGIATVGNFGSHKRFDYTLIGDAVNAASRIESLNKEYSSHIIISESTLKQLTTAVNTKDLGFVQVKGKEEPIRIYQLEV